MSIARNQTRNIVIALVVFILMAMGCGVLIQHIQLEKTQYQWQVKKKSRDNLNAEMGEIAGWLKQFEKERMDFSARLFTEEDVSVFVEYVSQYAKKNALEVVNVKTGIFGPFRWPVADNQKSPTNEVGPVFSVKDYRLAEQSAKAVDMTAMSLKLKVKGRFSSIVKLLEHIQRYRQILNVVDVKIQSAGQYPVLDAQVTLMLYGVTSSGKGQYK